MKQIATPSAEQAEGYVATTALFLISSHSSKEEKAYLRLPSVWRELWSELGRSLQDSINTTDLGVLRELRQVIQENTSSSKTDHVHSNGTVDIHQHNEPNHKNINGLETNNGTFEPFQDLIQLWTNKASTASFERMLALRRSLPIWTYKDDLLQAMEKNQVVIVCGETGNVYSL